MMSTIGTSTQAAVTLAEGDKGKLDAEIRLMFWGISAGRDSVPPGSTAQNEDVNDFLVRRGRIVLRAQTSNNLQLYCQFGQDNLGGKVLTEDNGMRLKDLFLNYKFAESFQAVAGQFKVPFSRQSLETGFNQLLVDRVVVLGARPGKESTRDLGVMGWGNAGGFQYRVGVFDGTDQEGKNPNSSLRYAARFSYNWFTKEPTLSYTGTWIGEKKVLQVGGQVDSQADRLDPKDDTAFVLEPRDYSAWAVDLYYDQPFLKTWALTLESAWFDREDNYLQAGLDTRSTSGYYGQAGLLLPWQLGTGRLQFATRYARANIDRSGSSTSNVHRSVGATYFIKGHDRKIQLDFTNKTESPVKLDNDEVRLSVITVF